MTFSPYRVDTASHWVFEGLGLKNGDLIGEKGINGGAASGWEADQVRDEWSPENITVLARGINPLDFMPDGESAVYPDEAYDWDGSGGAHMTYYDHPGGGGVFSVGSDRIRRQSDCGRCPAGDREERVGPLSAQKLKGVIA